MITSRCRARIRLARPDLSASTRWAITACSSSPNSKLSFIEAQAPPLPAGFNGQNALFDFINAYYVAADFPPPDGLSANFLARSYAAGIAGVPIYPQTLAVGFLSPTYAAGPSAGAAITQAPLVGAPVLPDPPYAIGVVTPGTPSEDRLGFLILGEATL